MSFTANKSQNDRTEIKSFGLQIQPHNFDDIRLLDVLRASLFRYFRDETDRLGSIAAIAAFRIDNFVIEE